LNLKSTGARANANADTLETSDADRSQVAESIGANQGNRTSVKKAPTVESADVLDEMVGAGDAVDIQEAIEDNSTGFKTSDLFENEQQPIFAYEEEEAFA
jgi:endonuclease YncB( thermonuclease family)